MAKNIDTDRIQTVDSDGKTRVVIERTEIIEVGPMLHDSSKPQTTGAKSYRLLDGTPVNKISDDTWELYLTTEHKITLKRK